MELSYYTNFSNTITAQEAQISTLQQQISTGLAVQTPDQNPSAYETGALGTDQVNQLNNDNSTQASVQAQLGSVSDAYTSTSNLLDNVQAIIEEALNGTTNMQDMSGLAVQVQSAQQQMLSIANSTGADGSYLFGGSRSGLEPFQQDANGNIAYYGDGGTSQASISQDETVGAIANGDAFVSGLAGDGISYVTASSSNTGSGQIIQQGVVNASAANSFQQGNSPITVSFATSGTGVTYTATQGGSTIATDPVSPDSAGNTTVQMDGVDYAITGTPGNGDSFTISPSRPQSVFSLLNTVYTALDTAGSTPAQVAQTDEILNQSLATLEQYQQNITTAQAQTGVTLQAISTASASNTNQSSQDQTTVNNAVAVNTPAAMTELDDTLTSLQAAMKTFGTVQSLSLFNYL
jgi:flagellar hook-associated protein 3 FlgL